MKAWLITVGIVIATCASAHDYQRPELKEWFQSLKSPGMGACCDGADATHIADPDWRSNEGHYEVKIDGAWQVVPDSAVVPGPNLDGPALLWTYPMYAGGNKTSIIRCFMPGSGV